MNRKIDLAKLAEYQKEAEQIKERLSTVNERIRELTVAIVLDTFKLEHEKTILTYRGKTYLFSHIDRLWDTDKPWVYGHLKKADGSFGKAVHRLYGCWEIVK